MCVCVYTNIHLFVHIYYVQLHIHIDHVVLYKEFPTAVALANPSVTAYPRNAVEIKIAFTRITFRPYYIIVYITIRGAAAVAAVSSYTRVYIFYIYTHYIVDLKRPSGGCNIIYTYIHIHHGRTRRSPSHHHSISRSILKRDFFFFFFFYLRNLISDRYTVYARNALSATHSVYIILSCTI